MSVVEKQPVGDPAPFIQELKGTIDRLLADLDQVTTTLGRYPDKQGARRIVECGAVLVKAGLAVRDSRLRPMGDWRAWLMSQFEAAIALADDAQSVASEARVR